MQSKAYLKGTAVEWKWMGRTIAGEVIEIYLETTTQVIKGKTIKRNGTIDNPAYLVQSAAGNCALKLHTELEVAGANSKLSAIAKNRPTMFK
jgi:hypothetical protein